VISLAVGLPAGYAAARFHFRGKNLLMIVIMATAMVPSISLIVPIYLFLDRLELLNNNLVIMIVSAARLAPQTVWFCRNFVSGVPVEIEEAALMDGASRMQILMRLIIPLIKPGLAAIIVLGLIHTWNDYVIVAVFAPAQATRTLQVALVNQVFNGIGISWSYFMAYAIVASVPVVGIFLVAQKWFVAGLTAGATKG
jgi:multiple sugar transport system permease protein